MRSIAWVRFPAPVGRHPALILTRQVVREAMTNVSCALITSTVRGLSTEVPVGEDVGLEHDSVVSCDNVLTVPKSLIDDEIGYFPTAREPELTRALMAAYNLADPDADTAAW